MRIVEIHERTLPISRYADPAVPSGGLTTSAVAIVTDVRSAGGLVTGYGFASMGRYAQGGLMRDRFAPRLLAAAEAELVDAAGTNLDPFRAWQVMMAGEKPGGHGERCVAVGMLDMALWDAAAKIAGLPLYRHLADRLGDKAPPSQRVAVYAGGGYYYPADDVVRLGEEIRRFRDLGFDRVKIKIGGAPLAQDLKRIEAAARLLPDAGHLARSFYPASM
jgi:L-alanine-DL-glutamate epimerase-like enolase superfamily enzyme